jgi:hypothetical protein
LKVISIIQPWATLIALGEKQFETRSWATKYRGELAVHATKKPNKKICGYEPFRSVLGKHGYTEHNLSTGVILATCKLANCVQVVDNQDTWAILANGAEIEGNEYRFGNFSEGRFAWQLSHVNQLEHYVAAKGKLGLWEYPE